MANVMANLGQLNEDDNIIKLLNELSPEQKDELLGYISNLYKKQDQMVLDFFQTKPKILEALLSSNTAGVNYNSQSSSQNMMQYYQPMGNNMGM